MSGRRSKTARWVVAERAVLTDMGVLADSFAQRMLTPSMRASFRLVKHLPYRMRARSVTLAGLAGRVLWFDAQVAKALAEGIEQVATIGAGYDSRPLRFGHSGVQFFELDRGPTQRDKAGRTPQPGVVFVRADLSTDSAADELKANGLDCSRPTLFVLEGVTMYLDEEIAERQLRELYESSAIESRLAIDFQPPAVLGTRKNRRQLLLQRVARIGSGEGFRFLADRSAAVALVEGSGWSVTEATSTRDAARSLVPDNAGLSIEAINEHKTLVAAVH